ncbi:3-oxoacyl-[acyl-carrier protein] reductase [Thalassobacillus cyri]|uniref:3-oxoacyl-[acyl-carrier protein] reductase n=1 Tax=Thalassobacillus cyri TaxID=571932 RepID=A0A1H4E682_9BACI|nr:SDR family NAD(P)-dependent oxidoreductase [Thalassobacillus cyri]SEA80248.1 3-oxoacyl-[acyl-carrier protein] reductase [Thalassobacillus cyri]
MGDLTNEIIIVTGSTRGIGRSTAYMLTEKGAAVVVNGRNEEKVEQLVQDIRSNGGRAAGVAKSVTEEDAGEQLVQEATSAFGGLTGIINNAGITKDRISYRMDIEDFTKVMDPHVKSTFICSTEATRYFKSAGTPGFILNMTSLAGLIGNPGQINYSAAKAAIIGMTMTMAKELKRNNIQVNALSPAALTDMTRPLVEKAQESAASNNEQACLLGYWHSGTSSCIYL